MSLNLFKNVLANFIGRVWTALSSLLLVPLYISYLGVESYGLTGFFALLTLFMIPIDSAINFTVNKELASHTAKGLLSSNVKGLLQTMELIFLSCSLVLGGVIYGFSSSIAHYWINAQQLSVTEVAQAIGLMGIALAIQWPISFYSSGMLGLQRQVRLNVISVALVTVRSLGAIGVLHWVESSIQAFFVWQIIISLVHLCIMRICLWKCLPAIRVPYRFDLKQFSQLSPFAVRTGVLSLLSFFLINGDKLIISKLANLEQYGYYILGASLASSLYFFITPFFNAYFPRFCEFVVRNDSLELPSFYFKSCQMIAVIVFPVAFILAFFSREILMLWTKNELVAGQSAHIVSLLALGTLFNGIMNMPFALQMAYGWMRLVIIQNIVSVIVLFPLSFILFKSFGVQGAACAWVIHNFGCVLICTPLIHRKLMPGVTARWFKECCLLPIIPASIVVWLGYALRVHVTHSFGMFLLILCAWLGALLCTLAFTPFSRLWIKRLYFRWSHI